MNIKIERTNERFLREMVSKNSRYGSMQDVVNEAVTLFYEQEKKRKFK
jgi:Arc/MetJ-type ribon-helix-helix transcriptional regulator